MRLNVILWAALLFAAPIAQGSQEFIKEDLREDRVAPKAGDLFMEYLYYEQRLFSSGAGYEIGEGADVEGAFQYYPLESSFFRFRFEIDPKKSDLENKTNSLELIMNHKAGILEFQGDLDVKLDDFDRGATTVGLDTDSEYTFVKYQDSELWSFTFFPYNFNGAVGRVFDTGDVTRIHYVEGTPDLITAEQPTDGSIRTKTLPGVGVDFYLGGFTLGMGYGASRYLYPKDDDFSFAENVAAETWESRTDKGYRASIGHKSVSNVTLLEFVSHDEDRETGALLRRAASLQFAQKMGGFQLYSELAYSMGGRNPYDLDFEGARWFRQTTPLRPVYSDFFGERQDWIGKEGYAGYVKMGYELSNVTPYLLFKRVGQHFVYFEEESAHRLRTADGSQSHGGLNVFGLGSTIMAGDYKVTPEVEHKIAKNDVFVSKDGLRSDRQLTDLAKKETSITLYVTYEK